VDTSEITIESILAAMRRMEEIPKPQPAIVQCLERDKEALKRAFPSDGTHVNPIDLAVGSPVHFYADAGEMAEDFFRQIGEGVSVFQVRNE